MRIPDPKANTTTEAYLAYKAGYLEESELKSKLYKPDWHFDGWLAYWAGLTNTYPLDENGDPEMLCDEEALVAYLSGVTDTYPEEIKNPYDVRIVGYLKHLAAKRWPEPDYPVNNEEFYLSTMEPTHTSNPTPSADIELDTSEGKIISVEAYGDTFQQTYSGKNLLNTIDANTTTTNGVTYYRNEGTYYLSGTNTKTNATWVLPNTQNTNLPTFEIGQTYTMSFKGTMPNGIYAQLNGVKTSTGTQYNIGSVMRTVPSLTFTIDSDYSSTAQLFIGIQATVTNVDCNFAIQIEKGSTATSYEPYTGNQPSPSPDYPQEIQVVSGDNTIKVEGKNLFDKDSATEDKRLDGNGSLYDDNLYLTSDFIKVKPSTTYSYTISDDSLSSRCYCFYDIDKNFISRAFMFYSKKNVSISTTSETYYIRIAEAKTINFLMLNEGSTALPYEPYQSQTYPINLGNIELCKIGDYQDYLYKNNGKWYKHNAIKKLVLNGTEGWSISNKVFYLTSISDYINSSGKICLSDKYIAIDNTNVGTSAITQNNSICFFSTNTNPRLYIRDERFNNVDAFRAELSKNNVKVYYPTVTPTDTEITDSTLIAQLNALAGADTYDEKTYIKVTANDPNLPALLKVEAYKC